MSGEFQAIAPFAIFPQKGKDVAWQHQPAAAVLGPMFKGCQQSFGKGVRGWVAAASHYPVCLKQNQAEACLTFTTTSNSCSDSAEQLRIAEEGGR